jgi:hypothetical protein
MMRVVAVAVAVIASLVQLAVVPAVLPGAAAVPLLPLAILAAWSAVRPASEVCIALPAVAIVLGVSSQERVGWYLLACVPLAAALLLAPEREAWPRRLARVPIAAGVGACAYAALLLVAAGRVRALPSEALAIGGAGLATALIAALCVAVLLPLRLRSAAGLFE